MDIFCIIIYVYIYLYIFLHKKFFIGYLLEFCIIKYIIGCNVVACGTANLFLRAE